MSAIAVRDVSLRRRGVRVLAHIDLEVERGGRLCLLGPSGSGKTTLLRVMAGLQHVTEGQVEIEGRRVERLMRGVTMIFQEDAVYEHLDVASNLAFPLECTGREEVRSRVEETARRFALARVLDRSPRSLSAGQRTAVAAARALMRRDHSVVLLDDPLKGADLRLRQRLVEGVMADSGRTVVFATREGRDALRWADRVAVLSGGKVVQLGEPMEVYLQPVSLEVAETMGELNRIPATASPADRTLLVQGSRLALPERYISVSDRSRVVIGARPSQMRMAEPGTPFANRLRATVGRIEEMGSGQRVLFGLGDRPGVGFSAVVGSRHRLWVGARVDWVLDEAAIRLYDPVGGWAL